MTVRKRLIVSLATVTLAFSGFSLSATAVAAVVLQYHHVSDSTPAATSVTPERFRQHMDYVQENGFEVVPLEDLVELLKAGKELPDKTVAITFDDAYDSVYETAFPVLKKRDWPFTVFVNTDPVDAGRNGFNSWEELREMAKAGATIANHSTKHNHLQRRKEGESRKDWQARIKAEVLDAEKRIEEETGQEHKMLAYPYGEYNNELQELLKQWGFVAFGQQSGPLAPHSELRALPRFPFGGPFGEPEDFATKVNSLPMPLAGIELFSDEALKDPLDEVVVAAGARPVLALTLENEQLGHAINCFASGQGAIKTQLEGDQLITLANKPLTPGRVRYNCTAGSDEKGRFYWFSQQWLVTDKEGRWVHND